MGLKEIQVPFHSHRNLRGIWVHVSDFKREIWGSSLIFRKGKRRESWKLQMCKCITWRLFHFNTHLHCTDRQIICEFFRRIWSSLEHEWLCHHPPTFACWNPIPPCSSVWRWGLRVVIRSWKYSHHGGINALIKGSSRELSFCLSPYTHTHTPCEDIMRKWQARKKKWALTRPNPAGTRISDIPASKLCSSLPVYSNWL